MIAKLTGTLDDFGPDWAVIDVAGVGYLVQCSARTLSALGVRGDRVTVHTEMQVSETDMRLIGFASGGEREWFRLLTGVQGVGSKMALAVLFIAPLGFATGMLAATIAVGGFIGVPAMIYVLGAPALMASATELVIAFVMGLGGTILYALDGVVDIRLAMIILAGSLFGIQIGAIGTTYVKDSVVKLVMGLIMVIVLFSRFFYVPGYLSRLELIKPLPESMITTLKILGDATLVLALAVGGLTIIIALIKGMAAHRLAQEV